MKRNRTYMARSLRACLALPLAALLWLPSASTMAQTNNLSTASTGQSSMMGQGMMQGQMSERAKTMKDMQKQMDRTNAKLDKLLAQMNSTTGTGKIDAMAAVLNQMADQQEKMERGMAKMQSLMMQQTTTTKPTGVQSPESCPMMKGMKDGSMMDQKDAKLASDGSQQ